MLKIQLKLRKINQAKRIVDTLLYKQKMMTEEDKSKEFMLNRQRNEKLRFHVAF